MSTNISKERRRKLVEKINAIKAYIATVPQDENTAQLLTYIAEIEKDIKGKKYGLVFEEHRETIDEILENNTPVLTEDADLFIDNGGQMNFLIEGDNLASLQLLEKTHKGKVDLIYIDPPYNTGNKDFVYDDKMIGVEDCFKHSMWLSFIESRIKIAQKLLSPKGVMFISIDDNEQSTLKVLCDEIMGENSFIAVLPRVTKKSGKDHAEGVAKNHDYILIYVKNRLTAEFKGIQAEDEQYPLKDEYFDTRGGYKLNQTLDYDSLWYNPTMDFPINVGNDIFYPGGSVEAHNERHNGKHKPKDWVWRWSIEKFNYGLENGFVVIKNGKNRPRIYTKTYANASISNSRPYKIEYKERETLLSSIALTDNKFSNDNAKKEISKIGLDEFGFPKPTALIIQLLQIVKNPKIILDFFAGSGTTGHAVMKLNAEDGGNRKFILCTNNENNICRKITYERIKRVIDKEDYKASLKYMKVDFVPISNKLYYEYADELLLHIRELVELENGINFNGNDKIAIILTEEELDNFMADISAECRVIYLGHDVLPTQEQETLFKKYDIAVNIIPDYYYRDLEG